MRTFKRRGVTLVELLVAAALASMVMGSAMGIWTYARRNISRTTTRQILQMDAQRVLTQLKADLKAARADTFNVVADPLTLEFRRYVVSSEDNSVLSAERTEQVRYVLNRPILSRAVSGQGTKTLSRNVENLRIDRKALSEEQRENAAYLESRVDVAIDLACIAPGTTSEEKFAQHTSVVIRDEFYSLMNPDRQEVLEVAREVAEEINREASSSFFNDALNAELLVSLTEAQLADLESVQQANARKAMEDLAELDNKIGNVDTGKKWWQVSFIGFLANEEGAKVKELRNRLEGIRYSEPLPAKDSNNRPSDRVDQVLEELKTEVDDLETEFFADSFRNQTIYDQNSEDIDEKKRATAQKRAYEMKLLDRQIAKAVESMSAEEQAEARAAGTIPRKMIEQIERTDAEIRLEIETAGIASPGEPGTPERAHFDELVAKERAEIEFLKAQYQACDLTWMDSSSEQNKIKAYEAAKQLKTLAESKRETLKLRELCHDNIAEINRARTMRDNNMGVSN